MTDVWTPERQALALAEAESWRGTQHANRIAARGRGIDCVRYVVTILTSAGVVESAALPSYPTAWGLGAAESTLGIEAQGILDADRIPVDEWDPAFGDICVWKAGKASNHCGIFLGNAVWHVSTNSPAGPMALTSARRRIQEAVRIRRIGWTNPPETHKLRFS